RGRSPVLAGAIERLGSWRREGRGAPPFNCALGSRYGQYRHDLDGIAGENGEMRMLFKELRGSLMRLGAHNREGAHFIADVVGAPLRDLLGPPQRSSHCEDGGMMLLNPRFPGRHAFLLFRAALAFGKRIPGRSPRAGFAAKEHGEIVTGRIHDDLSDLVPARAAARPLAVDE